MKKFIALVFALVIGLCFSASSEAYAKGDAKKLDIVPVTVSVGSDRAAVITSDGSLWTWGGFIYPYVDNRSEVRYDYFQKTPKKILEDVVSVSCGGNHAAAIKKDGTLWTWGDDKCGQLGREGRDNVELKDKYLPAKIMDDVAMVSCGTRHTAVLKKDGSLWLFGSNEFGQIGNDYQGDAEVESFVGTKCPAQTVPVKVMDDVIYVSCGCYFTTAIKKDGTFWAWGKNQYGQIGNGRCAMGNSVVDYSADVYVPQMIMEDVALASCGDSYTMVVKKDGTLWAWGLNIDCVFGVDSVTGNTVFTVPVKVMDDVLSVHCGYQVVSVIKTDGSLWMSGGVPAGNLEKTFVKVIDSGCRIAVADWTGFVVKSDGNLYGWGDKKYLGISSNSNERQTEPTKILGDVMLPDVPSVALKQEVNVAIESGLVPKSLRKNYQKFIMRGDLEKLLTQLIEKVGGNVDAREILKDNNGTFNPKGKVTESRLVTAIKRTAKALGLRYKSFGLKKTKTKLTTERAIVMFYRAYNMLKEQ